METEVTQIHQETKLRMQVNKNPTFQVTLKGWLKAIKQQL